MRTATDWFDKYGESHTHPTNKAIHWICIPVILVSTLGLLQSLPTPFAHPLANAATLVAVLGLSFYARLSATLFVGMAIVTGAALSINAAIVAAGWSLPLVSAIAFAAAWLAQFVGHKIEGQKPSFFEDVQFLLIGPAWLLQDLYRRVGIPLQVRAAGAR